MKRVYDEIASVQLPEKKLYAAQQKRILNHALMQIERETGQKSSPKSWRIVWRVGLAAALCCLCAGGVAAAGYFLQPQQVAQRMERQELAALFTGEDAVSINETKQAGNYTVSLLGLTSGENVTGYWSSDWAGATPEADRSYAVLALTHTDGTPMRPLEDAEPDITLSNSMVSPLLAAPDCPMMDYNVYTMNGARTDIVEDGIRYILLETDTLEPFADKNPQLAVIMECQADIGTLLNGYTQDPETGTIAVNENAEGSFLLFDLPIDESKADPVQAQALKDQWFGTAPETETVTDEMEEALDAFSALSPEEVRATGTLQNRETVQVSSGTYGTGWYFGEGGFVMYQQDWSGRPEDYVAACADDGRISLISLVTHHADDTLTIETWSVPVQ